MPLINYIGNRQECLGYNAGRGAAPAPPNLSVEYLIVGGGGVGGNPSSNGGSGGGFVSSSTTIAWNTTLGITVGAGGTFSPYTNGASSSISGSSFGYQFAGGADNDNSGEPQFNDAGLSGPEGSTGGGAGAGEDGQNGTLGVNGNGGDGLAWLNGIYYAGGGGGVGSPELSSVPGLPGLGGGGTAQTGFGPDGEPYQINGVNGLGGGAARNGTSGGSGVVIIRYPNTVPRMADGGIQYESGGFYYHEFTTGSALFRYQYEY
jgi:hypothetical protein